MNSMNFDFDAFVKLYKDNPEEYERQRKALIEAEIAKAPVENQHRLRQLQWQLDAIHLTRKPMEGTVEMAQLMLKKFGQLQDQLGVLVTETNGYLQEVSKEVSNESTDK